MMPRASTSARKASWTPMAPFARQPVPTHTATTPRVGLAAARRDSR